MNKLLRESSKQLFFICLGIFCAAFISIFPVILIQHKNLPQYLAKLNWPISLFFVISLITGAISGIYHASLPDKKVFAFLLYLLLYTACCALCQRLTLTTLVPADYGVNCYDSIISYLTAIPGLLLLCLSATNLLMAVIKQSQNRNKKIYLSWLLFLAGTPLIFSVWLPLLALPGAWLVTLWLD